MGRKRSSAKGSRAPWKILPHEYTRGVALTDLDGSAKHLLLSMLTWVNLGTGFHYAGTETMAKAIGKSTKTVQRALYELEREGWIRRSGRAFPGRARITRVNLVRLMQLAAQSNQRSPGSIEFGDHRTSMSPMGDTGVAERRTSVSAKQSSERSINPQQAVGLGATAAAEDGPETITAEIRAKRRADVDHLRRNRK